MTWHGAHFVFSEAKVNGATALSRGQARLSSSYPVWREHSGDYFLNLNAVAKFGFYN